MGVFRLHRPLIVTAVAMTALTLVSVLGLVLDDRVLVGAPIWLKPLKFAVSLAIYTATLAWLISLLTRARRAAWWLGTGVAAGVLVEMAIIVGQVVRGRQSHFNIATALDGALYSVMGVTIAGVWLATAGLAVLLLRQRIAERSTALAIRLALPIALAGMAVGFLMTRPTPDQLDTMRHTAPTVVGAHSVGVIDGGTGLPLLGWSTEGGDLRVGHFVGMHALQALPLLALALQVAARRVRRLRDERARARLVLVAAATYAATTVLVTVQALRGQPLVHPDALTLGAAGLLVLAAAAGSLWALAAAVNGRDRRLAVPAR